MKNNTKMHAGIAAELRRSKAGYFRLDTSGRFSDVNTAWLRMHGLRAKKEIIGKPFTCTQQKQDIPAAKKIVKNLLAGKPVPPGEFSRTLKDGTTGYHMFSAYPLCEDGSVTGIEGFLIDNTARHRALERHRQSEQNFKALLDHSPAAMWEEDYSGVREYLHTCGIRRIRNYEKFFEKHPEIVAECIKRVKVIDVNRATLKLYKARSKKQLLSSLHKIIPPSGVPVFTAGLCALLKGKTSFEAPADNRTVNGTALRIIIKWQVLPEYRETWGRLIITATDVTARERDAQELRHTKEHAEQLLNILPVLTVTLNRQGRITSLNDAGADILGCRRTDVLGKDWFSLFIPPAETARVRATFHKLMAGKPEHLAHYTNPVKTMRGEIRDIHWRNNYIKDAAGRITGIIASGEDITEQKQAERERAESETKFRLLSEKSPVGIYMTDLDGDCIYANPAWLHMAGMHAAEEAYGKGWMRALHPDDRGTIAERWYKSVQSGGHWGYEYRFRTPAGKVTWIWGSARKRTDAAGNHVGYVGTNVDISDRKLADEELKWELTVHNALSGMARMLVSPENTLENIADVTLKYAQGITGCTHGFVSVIDPATGDNVGYTLTKMMHTCNLDGQDKKIRFPAAPDGSYPGLWGHALNTKKGFFTNDPPAHPSSRGIPPQHIWLNSFLAVPALADFELYGEIALSNTNRELTDRDLLAVEQLGHLFALAVQRHRRLETLRENERKYRELFNNMQSAFALHRIITDDAGKPVDYEYLEANEAFEKMTGIKRNDLIGKRITALLPGIENEPADWIGTFGHVALTGEETYLENYTESLRKWYRVYAYSPQKRYFAVIFTDITGQKQAETQLESQTAYLDGIFRAAPTGIGVVVDRIITQVNPLMERMTGYDSTDLIGQNARILYPDDTEHAYVGQETYRQIHEQGTGTVETRWITKQGLIINVLLSSTPLDRGDLTKGVVFTALDITERTTTAEEIRRSLKEKEILLKEVHHRVKNNMQVISSLLNLQAEYLHDDGTRAMLEESRDRIRSMSLVHEQLYQTQDFAHLDIGQYLTSLVNSVARTYYKTAGRVTVAVDAADVQLSVTNAIPCGLIVNELVSNALKYAFPDDRKGTVTVTLSGLKTGKIMLRVADDGVGLPAGFDFKTASSLGLRLVVMLGEHQLEGQLAVTRENGTAVSVTFTEEDV